MAPDALGCVPSQLARAPHVLEAELADEDLGLAGELFGVGALVPDLHLVVPDLDVLGVLDFRQAPKRLLGVLRRHDLGLAEQLRRNRKFNHI